MIKKIKTDQFTGKKTIYQKVPNCLGICSIWDWKAENKRYERRQGLGNKYYAYKKVMGKQLSCSFESFEQAKAWRESNDLFGTRETGPMTFKEVRAKFFEYKKNRVKGSSLETYENNSRHLSFFDSLLMSQINPKTIDAWLGNLKRPEFLETQHKTRLTYEHELGVLRQILVYYAEYLDDSYQVPIKKRHNDDCIINKQRYAEAKSRNKQRFIPRTDTLRFLDEVRLYGESKPERYVFYLLAAFQLRTGTRIGEAAALDFRDLDLDSGEITISKTVKWSRRKGTQTYISSSTKTGETRTVTATDDILDLLRNWKQQLCRSSGLVFSHDGFCPLGYRTIQFVYNRAFKKAGLKYSSTHILRHSFATDFLETTGNQYALKELLGHSSVKQTEHYSKVTRAMVQEGTKAFNQSIVASGNVVRIH